MQSKIAFISHEHQAPRLLNCFMLNSAEHEIKFIPPIS